jgi:membrane associated rhomboid family serine protease
VILPLGDFPNPRGVPFVNYALLAINVAIFFLLTLPLSTTPVDPSDPLLHEYVRLISRRFSDPALAREILSNVSAYDLFVYRYGFRPADPDLANLVYSLFLHAGFLHLAGNMLFLWIYGDNVEHRLGHVAYAVAYVACGLAATLFHTMFDLGSALPLIGASGAISGVLGFYFLWFPRNQVRLLFFLFPFFLDVITVRARLLLGFYLVLDNLLPFLLTRGSGLGGIAHGAHIGGFLGGLAAAWWLDRRDVRVAPREYAGERADVDASTGDVSRLLAAGRMADAARLYFQLEPHATRRILTPAELLSLANWLRDNGHDRAALTVYRRQLRDYPTGPGAAEAHLGAGMIQAEVFDQATAAYQHFLEALDLDPSPETAARVRAALDMVRGRGRSYGTRNG